MLNRVVQHVENKEYSLIASGKVERPKVSVVVPVYNSALFLPTCLESIINQTFSDFEVICVNDGSTDNSLQILNEYAEKDKRIKVVSQVNQGQSVARNVGLSLAHGEYIYFMDSDDCVHPQLLEITVGLAWQYHADMVSFNLQHRHPTETISSHTYARDEIPFKVTNTPLFFQRKRCRFKVSVHACTKLYRYDFIKNTSFVSGIYFEDYPHTIALLGKHPKAVLLNEKLYYYTVNLNSTSHQKFLPKHVRDYHAGLTFIYEVYQNASHKELDFVLREIFPNILKQQLNYIVRSPKENQPELWQAFATELRDLNDKGCIRFRGHKLGRYLTYRRLIKKGTLNG